MGTRYLNIFGDEKSNGDWIKKLYRYKWERDIRLLSKTADTYTQDIFDAVVCTVQLEWIFLKRVTKDMVQAFTGLEKVLWETFLPCIFFLKIKTLPPIVGALSKFPIKKSGLGL